MSPLPPWLFALLLLFPILGPRLGERPKAMASLTKAARVNGIPAPLLVSVCFHESTLSARGAWCGALEGSPMGGEQPYRAAHALRRWAAFCGSYAGAVSMYRHGRVCRDTDGPAGYTARVMALAGRIAVQTMAGGVR